MQQRPLNRVYHAPAPSTIQQAQILEKLKTWRFCLWEKEWKAGWTSYGPQALVSDSDLQEISKRAHTLISADDIDAVTQILHLDDISTSLLENLRTILKDTCGTLAPAAQGGPRTEVSQLTTTSTPGPLLHYSTIQWADNFNPQVFEATDA